MLQFTHYIIHADCQSFDGACVLTLSNMLKVFNLYIFLLEKEQNTQNTVI